MNPCETLKLSKGFKRGALDIIQVTELEPDSWVSRSLKELLLMPLDEASKHVSFLFEIVDMSHDRSLAEATLNDDLTNIWVKCAILHLLDVDAQAFEAKENHSIPVSTLNFLFGEYYRDVKYSEAKPLVLKDYTKDQLQGLGAIGVICQSCRRYLTSLTERQDHPLFNLCSQACVDQIEEEMRENIY